MIFGSTCFGQNVSDSVIFSNDGRYVLFRESYFYNEDHFDLWGLYSSDETSRLAFIDLQADSAFILTSDSSSGIPYSRHGNNTRLKLQSSHSLKEFMDSFGLLLYGYRDNRYLTVSLDTIQSEIYSKDCTPSFYKLKLKILLAGSTVFKDTIQTGIDYEDILVHLDALYTKNRTICLITGYIIFPNPYSLYCPDYLTDTVMPIKVVVKNEH